MFNLKNNIIYIPKKNLGQNFLINKQKVNNIINSLHLKSNHNVIEIGPGYGFLTKNIYKLINKFFIIEIDEYLYHLLKKKYKNYKNIYIYNINILYFNIKKIIFKKIIIIGNLPYNISLKIINYLTKYVNIIKNINIMIQKEVYEKISATSEKKTYGKLSIIIQLHYKIKNIIHVSKECFIPIPSVESNFIKLIPQHKLKNKLINEKHLYKILSQFFKNKRKQINKIFQFNIFLNNKYIKNKITRAENISIYIYIKISNNYSISKESICLHT
ncbi:MAG: ribosomal RNA small subunit methyltransferase A [Candidatus Azosocius agrarius]|nr:MAG: ribosomal RNA small subunit methyltransferase A [Gammaproteobacteria bacterium]